MRLFLLSILTLFFLDIVAAQNIPVKVNVSGIRNSNGSIAIGIYKDQDTFSDRKPYLAKKISKTNLKNGAVSFTVDMPKGTYGVTLLDDENNNGKCDYGFILPNEGFGFSNYFHSGIRSPKFRDFKFDLNEAGKSVEVKVKYY